MKAKILSTLDNLNIDYHIVDHPPIMTMEEGSAIAQKLNIVACKNLFFVNKQREFFLLLLPAYKKLNTKNISKQIGSSHLSFASTEDMAELLHTSSGAVSILGVILDHTNIINLLIDKEVIGMEYIGCHPCQNTSSLKLKTEDVLNIFLPATNHAHYKIVE